MIIKLCLMFQVYIPCILFVTVSWISFIIDPKVNNTSWIFQNQLYSEGCSWEDVTSCHSLPCHHQCFQQCQVFVCFYLIPSKNIIIIFRANAPAAASSQLNAIESFIVTCIFSIFSAIIEYAVVLAIITLRFVKYSSPFSNIFITEKNIISQKFLLSSKFLLQCLKCTTFSSPSYMKGIKRIWRMQGKEKKT